MPRRSYSLRARVTAVVAGLTLGALALGFALLAYLDARAIRRQLTGKMQVRAHLAAAYARSSLALGRPDAAREDLANLEVLPSVIFAALYDQEGTLFASFPDRESPPPRIVPPADDVARPGPEFLDILTPVGRGTVRHGTLHLRVSWEPLRTSLSEFLGTAAAVLLLVGAVSALLALPLSQAVTRELEASEERYRTLLGNIPDVVWTTERNGRTTFISPVVAQVFGYSPEEVYSGGSEAWLGRVHEEDRGRVLAAFEGLFAAGTPYDVEYRLRRKDGSWIWVHDRSLHVYKTDGTEAADGVFSDVTARREAEEEVRRLNAELAARLNEVTAANKELESFAYSVSHDLRAPLRAIDGFTSILADRHAQALPGEARPLLERVRARCAQMGELIDALLALSRLGRHSFTPSEVDLSRLVRSAVARLQAEDRGRRVEFKLARSVKARGDEVLLGAVIENLLGNAWKFTAGVAEARVEFGVEDSGAVRRYYVRDNGPGFEMAHARRIFEPFHRLHPEGRYPGTGIGLAIVERVVARHGGKVWAESLAGRGATFYFTLEG